MDEWEALEDAIQQENWLEAARRAQALLDAWGEAKSAVLWFASDEMEAGATRFEGALSTLVALLGCRMVDAKAVDGVRAQVRAFLLPEEGE